MAEKRRRQPQRSVSTNQVLQQLFLNSDRKERVSLLPVNQPLAGQTMKSMILMTEPQPSSSSTSTGQWGQLVVRPVQVRAEEEEVGVDQHVGVSLVNLSLSLFYL